MRFLKKLTQKLVNQQYARLFYFFTISFAFSYHAIYLCVFNYLKIEPMFYFNIVSVLFYLALLVTYRRIQTFVIPVLFFLAEVITHQIQASYYLGGDACFHYLILLSAIVPLLTFESRIGLASFCGFAITLIFAYMEANALNITPQQHIPESTLYIIRTTNIISVSLIDIGTLICYSYIVWHNKYSLEARIHQKEIIVAKQNKKMFNYQNNIIISLANLVENRDIDTGEHIRRTSNYVELISREAMKRKVYPDIINEKFIERVVRAAPLHDVGKILISDNILKKPGRLTPEEFEMIKIHTKEGGRIINEIIGNNDDKDFENSRYKDSFESIFEIDGTVESAFLNDVVKFVDANYRTLATKEGRAIAGLSVGGLQSMYLSANFPDTFGYVGMFSPMCSIVQKPGPDNDFFHHKKRKLKEQFAEGNEPLGYYLYIGKSDFFRPQVRMYRKYLDRMGYRYTFTLSDGGHQWINWRQYYTSMLENIFRD